VKEISESFSYRAGVAAVFELISTGAFQLEIIRHLGGHDGEVVEETGLPGGGLRLVTRQKAGVELPGFAAKLIPANTTVVQTYEWDPPAADGARHGTWKAEIKGAPISIGGPTELRSDGAGSVHIFRGQVKASVPIVGGKLESFALENLRRDLGRSADFTADRLGSRRAWRPDAPGGLTPLPAVSTGRVRWPGPGSCAKTGLTPAAPPDPPPPPARSPPPAPAPAPALPPPAPRGPIPPRAR
jgi:hypothetical protein